MKRKEFVGFDGIDNNTLSNQLILLYFGKTFPNSLHQKIENNLDNCHPQKDKNNSE